MNRYVMQGKLSGSYACRRKLVFLSLPYNGNEIKITLTIDNSSTAVIYALTLGHWNSKSEIFVS